MPENETQKAGFDWRITSFEGARREQLRRWAELPLENILRAIEEMQGLAHELNTAPSAESRKLNTVRDGPRTTTARA